MNLRKPFYVCVHVPEFPTQALLGVRPEQARGPAVVMAGTPPLEQVCSGNSHARRMGVLDGTTRAELESFPGVRILRRSIEEERAARGALVEAAGAFTPQVEVLRNESAVAKTFTMVLDMSGAERVFGTAGPMLKRIEEAMRGLGLRVQLAASANFHVAVCMAPSAVRAAAVVPLGRERERLSVLPLMALDLTPEQQEMFALWGLRTMGELSALPETEPVVRLGQEGRQLRMLARGEHPHLMVPEEPKFELIEFIAFDSPVEMLDSLLFVIAPMLQQLSARAQNRAYALASVTVTLALDGGGEHVRVIKPALPVMQHQVLVKLLHLDLQAHPPSAGVMSVRLMAEPGDRSKVQMGLFAPQLPEPMRLDVILARIAALVGEENVGRVRLLDTHKPDSFVMERFVVPSKPPREETREPEPTVALRRCRPPVRLTMEDARECPARFFLHGKRYIVEQAYGPWRKSGDWWSAKLWSREEWDVVARAGEDEVLLCVVAHDLLN